MERFALGLDFGTLNARALLVNVENGDEISQSTYSYPDGVINEILPNTQTRLGSDWALQNPADYLTALKHIIPDILNKSGINSEEIIGIGVDFTSCTILPIDKYGTPLCMRNEWRRNPHAWVKLWKHHAAEPYANRLKEIALERQETFIYRYGEKISSEWMFPKIWQILEEAPELYRATDRFIEAGDWLILQLTGKESRSSCNAGYKAIWDKKTSYPPQEFFAALHPDLKNIVNEKLSRKVYSIGSKAGGITPKIAQLTGLKENTPVAVGLIDAHSAVPATTVTKPGKMVLIMGTSICHMLLSKEQKMIPGIAGVVEDGIIPGYFGYEAGQAAVGDIFDWFVSNCISAAYKRESEKRGIGIYQLLKEKASKLEPGENGLVALDWWNGNRSVLNNANLSGLIVGLTLNTKPEEIYRAIIECTAFGTRMIIENFENNGIMIEELYACGGMPHKDELLMQIYSDITGREIKVAFSRQASALGAAMFGTIAAGSKAGGYDSIEEAVNYMASIDRKIYIPNLENVKMYNQLFEEYTKLHDYFGRGMNHIMEKLKKRFNQNLEYKSYKNR
jgi:L-ribulokinase